MTAVTRRNALAAGVGTLAAFAVVGVGAAWRISRATKSEFVIAILRDAYPYLHFSDATAGKFATDFLAEDNRLDFGAGSRAVRLGLTLSQFVARHMGRYRQQLEPFEQRVTSQFLLSTDFFQNRRDTRRELQYVAYPDPYKSACANPLVRLA